MAMNGMLTIETQRSKVRAREEGSGPRALRASLAANGILFLAAAVFYRLFRKYQRTLYLVEGRKLRWPIPMVPLGQFDAAFRSGPYGPGPDAEVHFIGKGDGVQGGTSDREAWILSVLAKRARCMFEFGTCTGKTTYLWARNAPEDARIFTITLPPDQLDEYAGEAGDSRAAEISAKVESGFDRFLYSDTPVAPRVEQLFGDSKKLDETPFAGRCDLIFIDGSHAYSYVRSDTEKAMRMLAPGGIVLWHDYKGPRGDTTDVFSFLNQLSREIPLVHLEGTTLVAYRSSPGGPE
jgi:hypothetical protein